VLLGMNAHINYDLAQSLLAARVADLTAPGQVVLKLAVKGFGVRLPDA
jgi:hypothetical protein